MTTKNATTYDQQIKLLMSRNCQIDDIDRCRDILQQVNYYRLSAYFLPFKQKDNNYKDGTNFNKIYEIYEFDRKMRCLLFSAIEQIELYLRTQLAYYHAHKYGPLGYMNEGNYSKKHDHERFTTLFKDEVRRNTKVLFVKHHIDKYNGNFPIWVATELFSLGMLSFFFSDMNTSDKKVIAKSSFDENYKNVDSWLRCCTDLRNICAHYGRLYYRIFPAIPATPSGFPIHLQRRLFDNIVMLKFLYPDKNRWNNEIIPSIKSLINQYQDNINLHHIGFPRDWEPLLQKQ